MPKIDTREWQEFKIGDLFDISRPVARSQAKYEDGNIPFVASGNFNNGVTKWCMPKDDEVLDAGNCITVSPLDGSAFYQGEPFLGRGGAGSAILMLQNKNLTELSGLFVSSVIRRSLTKYTYSDQLNSKTIENEIVRLPVDSSGNPDWAYMDKYMTKVMSASEKSLKHLRKADGEKHALDVSKWREFSIGDLFEKLQLDVKKTDFNKTFDVSEERTDEFNLPLVNAKHGNNGIMYYGREADFETATMTIDIVQNGAIATGDVYAQPQKTGVLWDAYLIKPKSDIDSVFTLMFLATVLEKAIKDKFSYDDKCVWDRVKMLPVKLPCTCEGIPDWAYMDEYMRTVMKSAQSNLSAMQASAENCVSSSPDGDDY